METILSSRIASEMKKEIVTCPLEHFINHYLPFAPPDSEVEKYQKALVDQQVLLPDNRGWGEEFFKVTPSKLGGKENDVFKCLQPFSQALAAERVKATEKAVNYHYVTEPHSHIKVEKGVSDHTIDGYFCKAILSGEEVASSNVGVIAEFKKDRNLKTLRQNRRKIVAAANAVMNDDPRRLFMYGLTIEDAKVSLWYFSRSHSAKSCHFDLSKEPQKLIKVFLSFLCASEEDIGYDPFVKRICEYGKPISYVYTINDGLSTRYFQTVERIYKLRQLCITGRATRVWKAKEVTKGPNGEPIDIPGTPEVVLRDVWIDDGAKTEREIQSTIFADLERFKLNPNPPHFSQFGDAMKEKIQRALETYKDYFLTIMCEHKGKPSKGPVKGYTIPKDLFFVEVFSEETISLVSGADPSCNNPVPSELPAILQSNRDSSFVSAVPRQYLPKRPLRTVYKEVCSPIDATSITSLADVFSALRDCFIALVLLYCAGWVHRDISCGNVLVSRGIDGKVAGKLSDLEYAKKFPSDSSSADPKTGTIYFMPVEILSGWYLESLKDEALYDKDEALSDEDEALLDEDEALPDEHSLPPPETPGILMQHNFQHDLESLWWLTFFILVSRVDHSNSLQSNAHEIFNPNSNNRRNILTEKKTCNSILSQLNPKLAPLRRVIQWMGSRLHLHYLTRNTSNQQMSIAAYSAIYQSMYQFLWHKAIRPRNFPALSSERTVLQAKRRLLAMAQQDLQLLDARPSSKRRRL